MAEPEYRDTSTQAYLVDVGDKIEIGGHLTEIIGIGNDGTHTVIIHALDLSSRVYELKLSASHPLKIQKKIKE